MTEQEAQVWVARLTRIWQPQSQEWEIRDAFKWEVSDKVFCFYSTISEPKCVLFSYSKSGESSTASLLMRTVEGICELKCIDGQLDSLCHSSNAPHDTPVAKLENFATQNLPIFRRGCWLSGCPIEATAHEKAEWMQDFTAKEIQAWNLKF